MFFSFILSTDAQSGRWIFLLRVLSTYSVLPVQLDMFGDENARMKRQKLENCVDEIRSRFGKRSIYAASLMGDLHMPGDGRHEVTMPGMMYT